MSARRQLDRRGINAWLDLSQAAIDDEGCERLATIVLEIAHRRRHAFGVVVEGFIDRVREDDRVSFRREHDRIGVYRIGALSRRNLSAREICDVNFFVDVSESQHRNEFRIERSYKRKRIAEDDLIRGLADFYFVKHAIRGSIEDVHRALFGVEHEAVAPAWSKPD